MSERPVNLIYGGAKVEIELPVTLSLEDIQNWIKNEGDFTASLKENGVVEKFTPNDVLEFKYNSQQSQPALKQLTLDQYHPKKKLIFYIQKISQKKQTNVQKPPVMPPDDINQPTIPDVEKPKKTNISEIVQLNQLNIIHIETTAQGKSNNIKLIIKPNTTVKQIEQTVLKGGKYNQILYRDSSNTVIVCTNKLMRVRDIQKQDGSKLKNKEQITMITVRQAGK